MQHDVTEHPQDAYADAVDFLTKEANGMSSGDWLSFICEVWADPYVRFGGCLFAYTGVGEEDGDLPDGSNDSCGCLTQVKLWSPKSCRYFGPSAFGHTALLDQIQADARIPPLSTFITVESLSAFAFYQREIDLVLGRKPLHWDQSLFRYTRE